MRPSYGGQTALIFASKVVVGAVHTTYHVGLSDVSLAYNMVVSILVLLLVLLYRYIIMVLGGIRKRPTKVQTNTEKNRA